jgi:long-chain acyl-CoA synthetase
LAQTDAPAGVPDSVPALLARNVAKFGSKPAYREKEFGIWQSWTWAEAAEEIEAIALGLLALGVDRGDHVAIIGRNRPALYWSMVAAQKVGAVPVPLYQDAVAEEMAYVLEHCFARFVICGDQEQVDKVLEVQERVPQIEHIIYLDPRGLRKYDHSQLHELRQRSGTRAHGARDEFSQELERAARGAGHDSAPA